VSVVPFTWRVGVDNCFGWLTAADQSRRDLVETHLFYGGYGLVVRLRDGARARVPTDAGWWFEPLGAETACAIEGLPAPAVDGAAELERRLDPFHVERHRSALWCALVDLIRTRGLPCGHSLRAQREGRWDGRYVSATDEDPETFAAAINERVTNTPGLDPVGACHLELAADARLHERDAVGLMRLLLETRWSGALLALPHAIDTATVALARGTGVALPAGCDDVDDAPQLVLL
jgi:hypothetical protein